jgi:hypothetical protein
MLQGMSAAALLGLVGCATTDSQVLPSSDTTSSSSEPTTAASAAAGTAVIGFTYTASSSSSQGGQGGGMVRNPYIAVWVEDAAGTLVKTVSLWHLQNGQDRWLSELYKWYEASGGTETNSSATRAPGSYTVAWDLTDAAGQAVKAGTYTVCVEALREHGPYSLVTGEIAIKGKAASQKLDDNSELSAATVSYQP